jgi:hypothetical protein
MEYTETSLAGLWGGWNGEGEGEGEGEGVCDDRVHGELAVSGT